MNAKAQAASMRISSDNVMVNRYREIESCIMNFIKVDVFSLRMFVWMPPIILLKCFCLCHTASGQHI